MKSRLPLAATAPWAARRSMNPLYCFAMQNLQISNRNSTDNKSVYVNLQSQLTAILAGERDFLANMANTAAVLFHGLPDLNWAGFYLFKQNELVLGPFQGKPACIRIAMGRGVCGTAALRRVTIVVPDVHAFPGHIACDADSRSEIVVPLVHQSKLIGVMDLDSPLISRFDSDDANGLESIAAILLSGSDV
jgi:GAF domain-containing protein